jgi:peptidoglycan/xylan/chitin deacetylase (PgdA/CDA1 family)
MRASQNPLILTFHSISAGNSPLKISPELFAQQMEWLRSNAQVVSLGVIVAALAQHRTLPERAVALTFDDGFGDFYLAAAPLLRRLGLPATIFLPTGYCGKTNGWPGQPNWVTREPLLGWEQVKELAREGFDFGAHTVNHAVLTAIPIDEAEREITESKSQLEQQIGRPVEFFCYPYGLWSPSVRETVIQRYRGACATTAGAVTPASDPFLLPRVDAHYVRRWPIFQMLFTTRFSAYLAARRLVRQLRGKPEGGLSYRATWSG